MNAGHAALERKIHKETHIITIALEKLGFYYLTHAPKASGALSTLNKIQKELDICKARLCMLTNPHLQNVDFAAVDEKVRGLIAPNDLWAEYFNSQQQFAYCSGRIEGQGTSKLVKTQEGRKLLESIEDLLRQVQELRSQIGMTSSQQAGAGTLATKAVEIDYVSPCEHLLSRAKRQRICGMLIPEATKGFDDADAESVEYNPEIAVAA